MPQNTRFSMGVSGLVDAPTAVCLLTDLVEKSKVEDMNGYRPFKLYDYGPGKLTLECLPEDAQAVRKFLRRYLSGRLGSPARGWGVQVYKIIQLSDCKRLKAAIR